MDEPGNPFETMMLLFRPILKATFCQVKLKLLIIYLHLAKKCHTKLKLLGFAFFIKNLASLFFAFNFNFTSRISRYKNLKVIIMKKLKLISVGVFDYTLHLTLKTQKSLKFLFYFKV